MATGLDEYRRKRNFKRTGEPSGADARKRRATPVGLQFVIQKHAATRLHYDVRLELDGVMKSWAVPKGPSLDPSVKRLAIEVEDHPMEYNAFEGTIPKGEYGGGTVMIWDRGTYEPARPGDDPIAALRRGLARGKVDIVLHGERLQGAFTLVRTRRNEEGSSKAEWLLVKVADDDAAPHVDITAEEVTSVVSGRDMQSISGDAPGWHSNREPKRARRTAVQVVAEPAPSVEVGAIEPMYASLGSTVPTAGGWTFEPKYDGIRILAFATRTDVRLITRNGKEKARQFPEVVEALRSLASRARRDMVLDGEIVAVDAQGKPIRFQALQGRMHLTGAAAIDRARASTPSAFIAFDILVDDDEVLLREPWATRRNRLEKRLRNRTGDALRLGETIPGDGREMLQRARRGGWEGIIAKRTDAPYRPGARSRDWLKLKIEFRQEFVVGGYTEPRESRQHLGAILLGYYEGDQLIYAGHTGGGFSRDTLGDMYRRLSPLERRSSPFPTPPKTNERAHWVEPRVVVEVKFSEWTADGKLRQPIFLGVRDDKPPRSVVREAPSVQRHGEGVADEGAGRNRSVRTRPAAVERKAPERRVASSRAASSKAASSKAADGKAASSKAADSKAASSKAADGKAADGKAANSKASGRRSTAPSGRRAAAGDRDGERRNGDADVLAQLIAMEGGSGSGTLDLGRGRRLDVSSLDKLFFPEPCYTKGDLMRYYAAVADQILPALRDRPMVLKRMPDGVNGQHFFQQRPAAKVPDVVRVDTVSSSESKVDRRMIGGDLGTLLYLVQLGCISMDPWHSRVGSPEFADYSYLDLDPQPKADFRRVIDVARWVREELDALGLHAALKTSGSRGLHIAIPLPRRTSYDTAVLLAQVIATRVAERHPAEATVLRAVKGRSASSVYVDYLQNVQGKSIASVYSVRAKPLATVSTPLQWSELRDDLDPAEFTMATVPERIARLGDVWADQMRKLNTAAALRNAAGA